MEKRPLDLSNILVVHFGQLGDVVLGLAALRAVRERFPDAHIATLTGIIPGEVVRLSGLANEVITVDRVELRDGPKLRSIAKILKFTREMRRRDIDLVIDLHSLKETNILAWLTRAKLRLLANRGNRSFHSLGNYDPAPSPEDRSLPLSQRYMNVLRPLGIDNEPHPVIFTPTSPDREVFSGVERPIAGFFPGAGHPSRCWPLANFAELATTLQHDGYQPAVFLGPEEAGMRDDVERAFPVGTIIIDGLNIAQFIAAAAELAVFITNDTGPMHLTACAGTPILLIMDERAPLTYLPLASRLEVVNTAEIDDIPVAKAYDAAKRLLA
ncbi:MAG TPA: glycosyltransferase family 9 protein [Pyrinomonadaceae bacterium]|nr:glycosyltransferase family 9 protein [Pyrinomonadaceae bacterium]